jgi:hypothetical protein
LKKLLTIFAAKKNVNIRASDLGQLSGARLTLSPQRATAALDPKLSSAVLDLGSEGWKSGIPDFTHL